MAEVGFGARRWPVARGPGTSRVQSGHGWPLEGTDLVSVHRRLAIVVGEQPPAMSISWEAPQSPYDSGFVVIFSEFDPYHPEEDKTPSKPVCLGCLMRDGDEQLGLGLDLARKIGRVDWDEEIGEWFDPEELE